MEHACMHARMYLYIRIAISRDVANYNVSCITLMPCSIAIAIWLFVYIILNIKRKKRSI